MRFFHPTTLRHTIPLVQIRLNFRKRLLDSLTVMWSFLDILATIFAAFERFFRNAEILGGRFSTKRGVRFNRA